jgi:hypothetical protein
MSTEQSKSGEKPAGVLRLPWIAAGVAAFAGHQVGQVTGFLGAQIRGAAATEFATPHMQFLEKAVVAGRIAALAGGIVALIAVGAAAPTTSGLRATIVGALVGAIGAAVAGFIVGYF